jgi:APA family basic amino acid/polyamine antiporter
VRLIDGCLELDFGGNFFDLNDYLGVSRGGKSARNGHGLRRSLGFWALVAFGVGDILGAGIYALIGEIAAIAGGASWIAFAAALFVAGLTALSYAELGSRFPKSGGEAYFCEQGLGSPKMALIVGWLVLCSGVVSMATVARAFSGYLLEMFGSASPLSLSLVAALFLMVIAMINFWGIRQTSFLNIIFTIIEVSGLMIVLIAGFYFISGSAGETPAPGSATAIETVGWTAILQAGALAFFAFIGFEDMVNVAEEVKEPRRTLPLAILVAVVIAGSIYMLVIWVATRVVPPAELGASQAPLMEVVARAAPSFPLWIFSLIALFAVANTGLLNFVTASRLLYGMAGQKLVPSWFDKLHPKTQTPHRTTFALLLVAMILAVSGSLSFLAGTTSILILLVFLAVNGSLLAVKTFRRGQVPPHDGFRVHAVLPVVATLSCLGLIPFVPAGSILRASILIAVGLILMVWRAFRPADK